MSRQPNVSGINLRLVTPCRRRVDQFGPLLPEVPDDPQRRRDLIWRVDELDARPKFDALDDLGQLIFS